MNTIPRPIHLYADGGVILKNPSIIGGTWAWILVDTDNETMIKAAAGAFPPSLFREMGGAPVTNNQTEMFALLRGLLELPVYRPVAVYSDSMVTLGRLWNGYRWKNIPQLLHDWHKEVRAKITDWNRFQIILLSGHPTRA